VTDGARRHRQKPDGVAGVPAGLLDHVDEAAEFERAVFDGGILLVVDGASAASASARACAGSGRG